MSNESTIQKEQHRKPARITSDVLAFALVICGAVVGLRAESDEVKVELKNSQGQSIGTATLSAAKAAGVNITLDVRNLPPGQHGFHFHQNAKCEGPTFESAGPHLNPDQKKHGAKNPEGPHAGDMTNFTVTSDGTARTTVANSYVTLASDGHSVFRNGGTALVIHAKADDMMTDPDGNAGDRIACGVIVKQ